MSRSKRIITEKEKQNICESYKKGISLRMLQKQTKLQQKQIKHVLTDNNIEILSSYEMKQKNSSLPIKNYFDNLGELECYVLGLIFGDGCVHYNTQKYKYAVTITSNDIDVLKSGQKLFGSQFPITKRKTSNAYNLVINSKHLCEELIFKFLLQSPKSQNLIWPSLPPDKYVFFISGLLSTDGCVRIRKKYENHPCGLEFNYSSNCLEFIKNLRKFLSMQLGTPDTKCIKINKTARKNANYSLRFAGTNASKVLNWIFQHTDQLTRCQRKYDIYYTHLTCVSNSII